MRYRERIPADDGKQTREARIALPNNSLPPTHRTAPIAALDVAVIAFLVGRLEGAVAARSVATRRAIWIAAAIQTIVDAVVAGFAVVRVDVSIPTVGPEYLAIVCPRQRREAAVWAALSVPAVIHTIVAILAIIRLHLAIAAAGNLAVCAATAEPAIVDAVVAGFPLVRLHHTVTTVRK
jgi:hypothetical protein